MRTILVVDDEFAITTTLETILGDAGYRVLTAADGRQGMARLVENAPDLILLNHMMPVLDGPGMLRFAKSEFGGQHSGGDDDRAPRGGDRRGLPRRLRRVSAQAIHRQGLGGLDKPGIGSASGAGVGAWTSTGGNRSLRSLSPPPSESGS